MKYYIKKVFLFGLIQINFKNLTTQIPYNIFLN